MSDQSSTSDIPVGSKIRVEGFPGQLLPAGTPVFRVLPAPAASTTTLPAVGATPTADVWEEVYEGSTTASYVLRAKAGIVFDGGTLPSTYPNFDPE
jgi:hypothetical protein